MKPNWVNTYGILRLVQVASIIGSSLFAASLKVDVAKWKSHIQFAGEIAECMQTSAWLAIPLFAGLIGLAAAARKMIGPPWIWAAIKMVLDEFHGVAFKNSEPANNHRVTLLKRVGFLWPLPWVWMFRGAWPYGWPRMPWSGWLVPKCRSGYLRQHSLEIFLAPDDAHNAEGIAGNAYNENVRGVSGLPELTAASSDEDIGLYAKETFMSVSWVKGRIKSGKPLSRSYLGIVVEVGNKPWGLIMLDSLDSDGIKAQSRVLKAFEPIAKIFSELLRRA